jgi:crotonobetainyl-CoA:carnitine CoA-transferase CaiB-like acyl-CoA transferase
MMGEGADQPLSGVKVLDLAWVVAGPLIGRSMADYGATVVRIDSARRVETARLMGPFPGGRMDVQQSTLYENCNAGKFGLALDLRLEAARAVVRDLAAWADVAVESFTPGQMGKWGLGYEPLAAINPGLIMVSTSLMGQSGPWTRYSGYGNHGAAIAGFQNIVGPEGGPPIGPFGPYTDYVAPRFGLVAVLAALDHRRRTGQGCRLDVSQSEAGMQFLAPQIADCSVTGRVQGCAGNRDAGMAPHGVFAAAGWDSWVALAARSDAEWAALARLIGGAAGEARFATLAGRKADEDALEALVAAWVAARTADEAVTALQALGVPAHLAVASEDFMADPQLAARGHFVRLAHPLMGEAVVEASRFRLSETPARYPRAAPVYGRDNREVLERILGYDDARITELMKAGAVG